jgi:hypothetical protein
MQLRSYDEWGKRPNPRAVSDIPLMFLDAMLHGIPIA